MTTTSSRFFDELAKLMTNAAGAAQGVRREIDTLVQAQVERVLNNLDIVKREEFDVVRDMAQKAREENDRLAARIAELESRLGIASSSAGPQSGESTDSPRPQ
jgi:hypothetical protein